MNITTDKRIKVLKELSDDGILENWGYPVLTAFGLVALFHIVNFVARWIGYIFVDVLWPKAKNRTKKHETVSREVHDQLQTKYEKLYMENTDSLIKLNELGRMDNELKRITNERNRSTSELKIVRKSYDELKICLSLFLKTLRRDGYDENVKGTNHKPQIEKHLSQILEHYGQESNIESILNSLNPPQE